METEIIILLIVAVAIWAWMAFLGVLAAKHDQTLDSFQKKAQIIISICIPYFGAALVLHLVNLHSPDAIPKELMPWPLRSLVFGKPRPPNKNRDDNDETAVSGSYHHHHGPGGGGGD